MKEFFDSPEELERKVSRLAEWVRASKHFIVFTVRHPPRPLTLSTCDVIKYSLPQGAGVSTAAGSEYNYSTPIMAAEYDIFKAYRYEMGNTKIK